MPVFPGAGFLQLTMIRSDHLDLASVPIFAAPPVQRHQVEDPESGAAVSPRST